MPKPLISLGPEWHIVTTPTDLEKFYVAVAQGHSNQSLLIVGPTSTGKTELAKRVFDFVYPDMYPSVGDNKKKRALYFDGGGSPAELYTHAYRNKDRTIFIDDPTAGFLQKEDGRRIWKQFFSTNNGPRQITWRTKAHFIEQEELEPSFWTKSVVIAVCNELRGLGPDIEAIKARCICLYYTPSLQTRLEYAAEWVEKEEGGKEIMNWLLSQHKRGLIRRIDQRNLYHALGYRKTEKAGIKTIDWKEYLLQVCHDEELAEPSQEDQDAVLLHNWVAQFSHSGVFTRTSLMRYCWQFRDSVRREKAIQRALDKGIIHLLPPPPRPKGDKTRQPVATYCLGKRPQTSTLSTLSTLSGTESRESSESRAATEPPPKKRRLVAV